MSTFRNPVGPLPPRVYWRRRLAVLLGLAAVIAIIVLIVVRPGAGTAAPEQTPGPGEDAVAETAEAADPDAEPAACAAGSVQIVAQTDRGSYGPGELPQLSWTATNTGAAPCVFTAGTDVQELVITSGADRIWSSRDCQADAVAAQVTLQPGEAQGITPIQWDRTRSSADSCGQEQQQVAGGGATYHLSVTVGEFESAETRPFILN